MVEQTLKHAAKAAEHAQSVVDSLAGSLIGMEDMLKQVALGLVAGEHMIAYGPPGTAKSMVARNFAKRTGLNTFSIVLSPDHTQEDIVGPFDPKAFAEGRWVRVEAGMAKAHIGFVDEIGKASGRVRNFLLSLMEERVTDSPTEGTKPIPLQMVIAASNETLPEEESALVDRFLMSYVTSRMERAEEIIALLTLDTTCGGSALALTESDLAVMREACTVIGNPVSESIASAVAEILAVLNLPTMPSPRRLKKSMRLAAASALLDGRTEMSLEDLHVLRHTLMPDPSDFDRRDEITRAVADVIERREGTVGLFRAGLEEVRTLLTSSNMRDQASGIVRASRLQRELNDPGSGLDEENREEIIAELSNMLSTMEAGNA
jgi:MoxR-like ATPase